MKGDGINNMDKEILSNETYKKTDQKIRKFLFRKKRGQEKILSGMIDGLYKNYEGKIYDSQPGLKKMLDQNNEKFRYLRQKLSQEDLKLLIEYTDIEVIVHNWYTYIYFAFAFKLGMQFMKEIHGMNTDIIK